MAFDFPENDGKLSDELSDFFDEVGASSILVFDRFFCSAEGIGEDRLESVPSFERFPFELCF